ncbi:tachykinin-like peptides receptor 86C isoform X1 [Harmonia axyridis]|uniref:tachykinin-like peptides receptor 86C isoform X1 n=1 Tax=Harmonia axyridis TaxID=115357 RepID=UPI001E27601D|nr:tachykinin-like peptides receptor 86C isoform X1 [Harmonia axyridis]
MAFVRSNETFEGIDYGPLQTILPHTMSTAMPTLATIINSKDNSGMSWWIKSAWTSVFAIMIIVACGGNCIVIWIVIAHRRMRTVTNYFLVNLSTADLLLTLLNCSFNFSYMIQRHWPFGSLYCSISNFIANATVAASVFTLTGISCDRYLAIVHPLQPRMSEVSSIVAIVIFWTASFIFALPCLIYSTTITHSYKGKETIGCILIWPDGKKVGSKFDFAYQMLFLILTYVIPFILMTYCYTMMGKVLWGSASIGEMTQRHKDSIRSKRKVVKMFILIVSIFGICWLPYHSYFLYVYYDTNVIFSKYTQHVYLAFYWLAMSTAMVNPLIYYFMNARFRRYYKMAVCGFGCYDKSDDLNGKSMNILRKNSHSYQSAMDTTLRRKKTNDDPIHRCVSNGDSLLLCRQGTVISKVRVDSRKNSKCKRKAKWIGNDDEENKNCGHMTAEV